MRAGFVLAMALLAGCASAPEQAPVGAPDLALMPGRPAPPQARLYADCIAQAAEAGAYEREADANTLRFTCTGDAAQRFHEGLGAWSASAGSEYVADGRTWRFSKKLITDSSGVDGCSTDGAGDYRCVVILNVGEFLAQTDYRLPTT